MSTDTLPAVSPRNGAPAYQIDHDAVLRAVGINARDPKAQALLLTCERYGLDPILKHAVLIQGTLYVTRDGLLHVAHRSGQLDGIEVVEQSETTTHHVAKVSVFRKDMGRPFTYIGRYPKTGGNKAYGPEMAVKCGEVMALRRAFDVGLCATEELWDRDEVGAVEAAPEAPVRPQNESGHKTGQYASPEQVAAYLDALRPFVEAKNQAWLDHWTGDDGSLPASVKRDPLNLWQADNHLLKWAVESGRLDPATPEQGKARQVGAYCAIVYHRDKASRRALTQEMARYADEQLARADEAIRAKHPELFGSEEVEDAGEREPGED